MALSRLACVRQMGAVSTRVLAPRHKVEMSPALIRLISSVEKQPGRELAPNEIENPPRTPQDFIDAPSKPRNWISYGCDFEDRYKDSDIYHSVMFLWISVLFVGGIFICSYLPDFRREDWALREAYLELARREKYGLPPVSKDLVPEERLIPYLPTEEELAEMGLQVHL